jgi:hypothetical protein
VAVPAGLLLAAALTAAPNPTPVPGPGLLPGAPLQAFVAQTPGLKRTGGLASPDMKPGFALETWQAGQPREWRVGEDILVGDPTLRPEGLVYGPRTTLVVQRGPRGETLVVATRTGRVVTKQKEIQDTLDVERAWIQPPGGHKTSLIARLMAMLPGRKAADPGLRVVLDNGRQRIWMGEASPSSLVTVVLEPVLHPRPEESEEEVLVDENGEEIPAATPTPGAPRPRKGLLEVLRFPRSHARIVLEELATWVKLSEMRR